MPTLGGTRHSRTVGVKVVLAAAMALLCTTLAPIGSGVAHASTLDLALCLEYDGNSYTPGITFTPKPTNMKTDVVEINGQQDQMIERLVASDPLTRIPRKTH